MAGVPTQEEFEEAARAAPPSPLDLQDGDKIIVGRGDGSPPCDGKLQQQRGVVTKVVQKTKFITILFDATAEKGQTKFAFLADELVTIGYACPEGVSRRLGGFCTEKLQLRSAKGSKSIETPRSPFEHYRNLLVGGFDFNISKDVDQIQSTDLAMLLRAPRPDSIQDESSDRGYKTVSHYIMDKAGDELATIDKNIVQFFKVFIVRHLKVIHHHLQGDQGPLGLAWFGGPSASGTTSHSAFRNNAHVFNVTQERVEKSLKLSSEGYSMSQEAVKRYEEAGAQHMSVTLLPFDPKAQIVATRGIVQQLGSLSEVTRLSVSSNLSNLPSLLDFLQSACDNKRSSHPTDRPPPPPPGAPPPRDSGPMPQDQWLRAITTIDGVQYPYWYNPARLDAQGRSICSWTCPVLALADEPATNSAGQSHRSASSGRELEPNLSNIAVTEVSVASCVNAGNALKAASTELERVFYEVYPGLERKTQELKPGLLRMIKYAKGGPRFRLSQAQAKSFDILDQLSLQNSFLVVPTSPAQAVKQSMLAALFSCEKKVAEARLSEAMVSKSCFYETLSRGDGRAESISCFVYDSGAYGLLPTRGGKGAEAVSLRKPRGSIFGTCFHRGDETNEDYVKASAVAAASAAPTTLRLVLSGGGPSSALFFPPWPTLNKDQRGVFQDDKATVCRLDAGSVVDSSIVFPLNRTYSVLSGEIVFIVWDLVSTTDSTLGTMLPEDIFSDNQPLQRLLREKIIKPSILHIVEGAPGSAFFRCGSVVSLVAVKTSVVTYGDWGDVTDTLRYGEVVECMQQGGLFDEDAQSSARLFVEGCLRDDMRPSCIPQEFQRQGNTLELNFSPGIYTDILCGFISSTARTVSDELISQLFGVGKVSADELMEIASTRSLVPDEKLIARTLTASCSGDGLVSGLRQEVVLNLSRVEIKLTSNEAGESLLFVVHWEKRAKRLRTQADLD